MPSIMPLGYALAAVAAPESAVGQAAAMIGVGRSFLVSDVTVVAAESCGSGRSAHRGEDVLIAVEIESPSSITTDRIAKPARYARDVHATLVEAAERAGKSLTGYLSDELALVAARVDLVWHNREVILAGQRAIKARPSTGVGAAAVRAGRQERGAQLLERTRPQR